MMRFKLYDKDVIKDLLRTSELIDILKSEEKINPIIYIGMMGSGSYTSLKYISFILKYIYGDDIDLYKFNLESKLETMKTILDTGNDIKLIYIVKNTIEDRLESILKLIKKSEKKVYLFISVCYLTIIKSTKEEIFNNDYFSISPDIRKKAKIVFIKSYFFEIEKYFELSADDIRFLKQITDESIRLNDYKAKKFGLVYINNKIKWNYIPHIEEMKLDIIKI